MPAHDLRTSHARPIKIKSVEAIPVVLPFAKVMKMGSSELRQADNLLVRIEAADGTVGWGEAASAPGMTGDIQPAMVAAVREILAPMLVGEDARARAKLVQRMHHGLYGNSGARSAVEVALADLTGRVLGVSISDLYGGALRHAVKPMWLVGNPKVEQDIEDAKARTREGYAFFKLKVGVKPVDEEIATAIAIRCALGPDVILCADANRAFDLTRAARYLAGVAGMNLAFMEQPLAHENLAGLSRLARGQPIPIGADEGIHSISDIEAHAAAGASGLSLKLIKLGGPTTLLSCAFIAERLGLSLNLASKVAESSLGSAATLHMACLVPAVDWGISLTHVYLAEDIARNKLRIVDGMVALPDGPGLGMDVDEAAVARFRVK